MDDLGAQLGGHFSSGVPGNLGKRMQICHFAIYERSQSF
jgi:hypothetical protein